MRVLNVRDRVALDLSTGGQSLIVDVAKASVGRPRLAQSACAVWNEFTEWAGWLGADRARGEPFEAAGSKAR
jgi:hypothetical protein